PISVSRWMTIETQTASGESADLLFARIASPTHKRPVHGLVTFPNERWRKYYSRVNFDTEAARLGAFYCTRAAALGVGSKGTVQMARYAQLVAPPKADPRPVELRDQYVYQCSTGTIISTVGCCSVMPTQEEEI